MKAAETVLSASRHYLRKRDDFMQNIQLALAILSEQASALRLLRDEDVADADLQPVIAKVIDIAVDGNIDNAVIARRVLSKYKKSKVVRDGIEKAMATHGKTQDEFVCRGLAELLAELDFVDMLKELLRRCKNSQNDSLRELYSDFTAFTDRTPCGIL